MNVIEKVKEILEAFPQISQLMNEIHVDFTSQRPTSYGLASVGDQLLYEDILGNQKRQHTFMLYSTFSGINDFERLQNSSAQLSLAQYLDKISDEPIDNGSITKITASNGMLYATSEDSSSEAMQYQLTIKAEYEIN